MTKNALLALLAVFLSSCASQNGGVKLDSLLDIANCSSTKNLSKIASSNDPKAAARTLLEHKRDPAQLARDLLVAKQDFDRLMAALSGNVKKNW